MTNNDRLEFTVGQMKDCDDCVVIASAIGLTRCTNCEYIKGFYEQNPPVHYCTKWQMEVPSLFFFCAEGKECDV